MRILITNDDGIHAPGLEVLERIARQLSDDIWIVAPETDQSGAAHSLTLSDPIRVRQVAERHFAVRGTPTDCVIMAMKSLMPEKPDLVLSGVNRGHNIAEDVTYSGTVAGAIEGMLLGVRSIALSQAYGLTSDRGSIRWHTAEAHAADVIGELLELDPPEYSVINVNFPDCEPEEVAGVAITRQGKRNQDALKIDARVDARGNPYYWFAFARRPMQPEEDTDLWALSHNRISVTPLSLDLTCSRVREDLLAQAEAKTRKQAVR